MSLKPRKFSDIKRSQEDVWLMYDKDDFPLDDFDNTQYSALSRKDIYEVLKDKTETAIKRARRQYQEYGDKPPSQRCPATRVFELVEELQKYLM